MSTAQTLREAAVTWPMPELNETEWHAVRLLLGPYEFIFQTGGTEHRLFMLLVAASLDGGERVPMSNIQQFLFAMDYLNDGHGLVRAVERYHGIGVSK